MTIVTIVLIAIVLGAGTLIVTNIVNGMKTNKSTKCSESGMTYNGKNQCVDASGNCYAMATNGTVGTSVVPCSR